MKLHGLVLASVTAAMSIPAFAGVSKSLPYPSGEPTADELADQVYFVNHFYSLDNYAISKEGRDITVLISRTQGESPTTITLERYLNNAYPEGDEVNAKDLAIFRSGKLRGTGMLITDFTDPAKSQSYAIWLPALRKIRRFAEPAHDDAWGGSDFTFGDVTLRKPEHETHEITGKQTFDGCLNAMEVPEDQRNKYMQNLPGPSCVSQGKEVFVLKSTTKFDNWWYDHRISYVDTKSFADYRTEYFKGGKQVKVIDRDWKSLGLDDPRAMSWGYWYGKTLDTGHETWAVIPETVVKVNDSSLKPRLWTERTLRKIKR
ncbi:MAG: outer membrane lipoprotein-sorting protein [Gammaproteobacteria bacterium]